jgi:hypothetical protein
MANILKVNVEIDLDEVKKQILEDYPEGLESSSGTVPDDLAQAWDEMDVYFPESCKPLVNAFSTMINVLCDCHNENEDD